MVLERSHEHGFPFPRPCLVVRRRSKHRGEGRNSGSSWSNLPVLRHFAGVQRAPACLEPENPLKSGTSLPKAAPLRECTGTTCSMARSSADCPGARCARSKAPQRGWTHLCSRGPAEEMLRIARELSESEVCSFSIFEDVCRDNDEEATRRHIEVQTEISCDHVALSTDLSISSDARDGSPDVVFWRSVATQRARELDGIKDEIKKIGDMTMRNIEEKRSLDERYDKLYSQMQKILENPEDDGDLRHDVDERESS